MTVNVNVNVPICTEHHRRPPKVLGALVPCEQKCLSLAPESSFGGVRIADRVWNTVPGWRTSHGKSPVVVRVESVTWYVQHISLYSRFTKN